MVVSLINRMDSSVLDVLGNCLGAEWSVTMIEATPSPGRSQDMIRARSRNRTGCQERRRYHEGMYGVRPQATRTAATAAKKSEPPRVTGVTGTIVGTKTFLISQPAVRPLIRGTYSVGSQEQGGHDLADL